MKLLNDIAGHIWQSLDGGFDLLWSKVSPILPPLAMVLIVLVIGLWVTNFISDSVGTIIKKTRVGEFLDKLIFDHVSKITGVKTSASSLISLTVKWFLAAIVLIAAMDLADLDNVIGYFNQVIGYIPNLFSAVLIILLGSVLGGVASTIIGFVTKKDNLTTIAKAAVNILAFIAAIGQLVTPIVSSLSQVIGGLSLSKLQADFLFIGVLALVLLASKNTVTKAVESLYKT